MEKFQSSEFKADSDVIRDMTLYHGSRVKLEKLEPRQARTRTGVEVPEGELLNAIYFTPDYATALAMAARPSGLNVFETKGNDRTIHFEHPNLFSPDMDVYIYSINSDDIPTQNLKKIDDEQYTVQGIPEITPTKCEVRKAVDVFQYYRQI